MPRIPVVPDENIPPVERTIYVGMRAMQMPSPAPFPGSEMPCSVCGEEVYCSTINEHIWGRPNALIKCMECAEAGFNPGEDQVFVNKKSHEAVMEKLRDG